MKNLFILACMLMGTFAFGQTQGKTLPVEPPITLFGQPATYDNGVIFCGENSGRCATIGRAESGKVLVSVNDNNNTEFTADDEIVRTSGKSGTNYLFSNVKMINE